MNGDESEQIRPEVAEFSAMLEPFADAMIEGDFDQAQSLMLKAFQWVAEHPLKESPADKLLSAARDAEQRSDWATAERLYREKLELEKEEARPARTHWQLGRLCHFLGRYDEAKQHGRHGYELSRDDEIEMVRAMAAVAFAHLLNANEYSAEVESALRRSMDSLPAGPMYAHLRAQSLVEIAEQRRLNGDSPGGRILLDQAFAVLEPQRALHDLPGYQRTISRAWQIAALIHRDLRARDASIAAWKNAIDWQVRARCSFEDESPIDVDEHSRFLFAAVQGLAAAGEVELAKEVNDECQRVCTKWGLAALHASAPTIEE